MLVAVSLWGTLAVGGTETIYAGFTRPLYQRGYRGITGQFRNDDGIMTGAEMTRIGRKAAGVLMLPIMLAGCSWIDAPESGLDAGRMAYEANEFSKARSILVRALQQDPSSTEAALLLARTKIAQGDGEGALATLAQVPVDGPSANEAKLLRAEAFLVNGDWRKARREVSGLNVQRVHYVHGLAAMQEGDTEAAEDAFAKGASMARPDPRLLAEYAFLRLGEGDLAEARRLVSRAEAADAEELVVMQARAEIALAREDFAQAAQSYQRAVRLYPESRQTKLAYANALGAMGRFSEAQKVIDAVVGHGDPDGEAAFVLAKLAAQRGEWRKVRAYLQPISGNGPPEQRALYAQALIEVGLNNLAIAEVEALAEDDTSGPAIRQILARAYRAEGDAMNARRFESDGRGS